MVMNQMLQFIRQISGRLTSNAYASLSDPQQVAYIRKIQREIKKNDVLNIPFDQLNVVVFDIETTGFYPYKGDRMLTIGAVKVQGENILIDDTFYSSIYSQEGPSEEIRNLTGITKEQLIKAPPIHDVLKEFYQFVQSDTLVAHHSNHEKQFMKHANWLTFKSDFQHRIIDTSFLTQIIEPQLNLNTLDEYCEHFGILNRKRHHALHDAIAAAGLWVKGVRCVKNLGYLTLNDVYAHIAQLK
jgi:DNA polymerase III subunit epsilon